MNRDVIFHVSGMTCASCAVSVESMARSVPGVVSASVNFADKTARVVFDNVKTSTDQIRKAVKSVGYDLIIDDDFSIDQLEKKEQQELNRLFYKMVTGILFTTPVFIISMFYMHWETGKWICFLLSVPVIVFTGGNFYKNAWKHARHAKANMDTLVALSTGIAFGFSAFTLLYPQFWSGRGQTAHVYFESATVIIAFIVTGKYFEEKARHRASSSIRGLMQLQPKTVTVMVDGNEVIKPSSSVQSGDIVIVKPGERIPVDGEILQGDSFADESMMTGEPMPVSKKTGDHVFAGTLNQRGSFTVRAACKGNESYLAHIVKLVRQAQGSKAPVQKLADRISAVFVPVVLVISILTFLLWIFSGNENALSHSISASIAVLIIACPCALGLATPTALITGMGKAASRQVLIKDAEALEKAHNINALILDKTGTITQGKPVVTDTRWKKGEDFRGVLLAMESKSEHPLANAITSWLQHQGIKPIPVEKFLGLAGKGVRCTWENKSWYAGNHSLMEEKNIQIPEEWQVTMAAWYKKAATVIYFSSDIELLGVIAVTDPIKPTSAQAIQVLQERGVEIHMLTGDNIQTAASVAAQTSIKHYKAGVKPIDKANYIKTLQQEGKVVGMAGDGINDSHALAEADVSIAMGTGNDIAIDVASITIINGDLSRIADALIISRKTVACIRQNLFWAFFYNVVAIPVAAGILYPFNGYLLNPMIAGGAMALSSLSVVLNSLRLKSLSLPDNL